MGIYTMKKKGGSIASQKVNNLTPKLCTENYKYPSNWNSKITPELIEKNYGIEYKTTGGKSKSKKYWLPRRYFDPNAPSGRHNQKGGEDCTGISKFFSSKTSVPAPDNVGIPQTMFDRLSGWFVGEKCNQPSGLPRGSPVSMEFKDKH